MIDDLARILREAGALLLERRAAGDFTYQRQGAVVHATVDVDAHRFLVDALSGVSSGLPVVSEEDASTHQHERPDAYWLIDPLDGTASFVDGFPGFVTQAALIRNARPVMAGVYAPALDELFLAEVGGGATRNGARIKARARPINRWTLTDNYPAPRGVAADLMSAWNVPKYLQCGSIGLKICRIADAQADIFIKDVPVRDWDVAAPQLVLEEAGGRVTDVRGVPFPYGGSFEHSGVIAGASTQMIESVVNWVNGR